MTKKSDSEMYAVGFVGSKHEYSIGLDQQVTEYVFGHVDEDELVKTVKLFKTSGEMNEYVNIRLGLEGNENAALYRL